PDGQWRSLEPVGTAPGVMQIPDASILTGRLRIHAADMAGNAVDREMDPDPTRLAQLPPASPAPNPIPNATVPAPAPSPLARSMASTPLQGWGPVAPPPPPPDANPIVPPLPPVATQSAIPLPPVTTQSAIPLPPQGPSPTPIPIAKSSDVP